MYIYAYKNNRMSYTYCYETFFKILLKRYSVNRKIIKHFFSATAFPTGLKNNNVTFCISSLVISSLKVQTTQRKKANFKLMTM